MPLASRDARSADSWPSKKIRIAFSCYVFLLVNEMTASDESNYNSDGSEFVDSGAESDFVPEERPKKASTFSCYSEFRVCVLNCDLDQKNAAREETGSTETKESTNCDAKEHQGCSQDD